MKNIWNDPRSLFNGNHFTSLVGERAKRARRYLVMFMKTRDIYMYICTSVSNTHVRMSVLRLNS